MKEKTKTPKKVFISHGHDEDCLFKLRTFLKERLNCDPVVLKLMPDNGLTIVEKLEKYGRDCSFAIILMTGDDETKNGGIRARQNVIHELGFFHGAIGREKVLLCKEAGVELFSNISGLLYIEFEKGRIENILEDVRLAIEHGNAQRFAKSVTENEIISSIFFDMGRQVKKNLSKDLLGEISAWEKTNLSNEQLREKIIQLLEDKKRKELEADQQLSANLTERTKDEPIEGQVLTGLFSAPLRAASERCIVIVDRCISDLKDNNLGITDAVALCKSRLVSLANEE